MKICWDTLEGVHLTRNGTFRKGHVSYIYKEACAKCGGPYLTRKSRQSKFCGISCASKGRKMSDICKKKLSIINTGKTHSVETIKKLSEIGLKRIGSLNFNYKGGVTKAGLTTYDTHKDTLGIYEEIRKQKGTGILEVKCAYCGRWFTPTYETVGSRLKAINNLNKGEQRLYCSENCKLACPTYGMHKYPKGFKHTSSREVLPALRKMVLERDNWTCQICGKTSKEAQLHVHHMDPVAQNPMFQNDMDSCITLCKCCHTFVHKQRGCRYIDLRCNRETDYTKEFKEGIRLKSISLQE